MSKRKMVSMLLDNYPSVLVMIDATNAAVIVPSGIRSHNITLRFGRRLHPAIVDMKVDDLAISGTLDFDGVPFWCDVPWEHVHAVSTDRDGWLVIWPSAVVERRDPPAPEPAKPSLTLVP
jgi:stringent starvation protein B